MVCPYWIYMEEIVMVKIISDSTCDLSQELLKKYDIDLGKQDQLNKIVTELNYELDLDKDNILVGR